VLRSKQGFAGRRHFISYQEELDQSGKGKIELLQDKMFGCNPALLRITRSNFMCTWGFNWTLEGNAIS